MALFFFADRRLDGVDGMRVRGQPAAPPPLNLGAGSGGARWPNIPRIKGQ